jgi:hypothetical protein
MAAGGSCRCGKSRVSRTLVFEELLSANMNLGRAGQITINLAFKHSRIKLYLKVDRARRAETVINDPGDLGCRRSLGHLD